MVPNINTRGQSFKGVTLYLMHDKGASTSNRVAWTSTHNLFTDDVDTAAKIMAWTDINRESIRAEAGGSAAGRKPTKGNVYHYSLSWKDGQDSSREDMESAAHASIERLGLAGHQYYLAAHNDTEHSHVHIVANLVNPETGLIHSNYRDQKILDRWAHEYEQEHGIVCEARAQKYQAWEKDRKAFSEKERREDYAQKVTEAFHQSDSAKSFTAALDQEGLSLAQGNRRGFVFVDERGKVYALNRLIRFAEDLKAGEKNKAITERLKGIERDALPIADALADERKAQYQQQLEARKEAEAAGKLKVKEQEREPEIWDRDQAEVKAQTRLEDAAIAHAKEQANRLTQEKETAVKAAYEQRKAENAARAEKRERFASYQRRIDEKIAASRETWEIDDLIRRKDEAAAAIPEVDGFWSRVFQRGKFEAAHDHLQDMEKRLAERTGRFEDDIRAIYRNRPQWVIDKEFEKQGIASGGVRPAIHQERDRMEAGDAKQERASPALKEAQASRKDQETETQAEGDRAASLREKHTAAAEKEAEAIPRGIGSARPLGREDARERQHGVGLVRPMNSDDNREQKPAIGLVRPMNEDIEPERDRDGPEIER